MLSKMPAKAVSEKAQQREKKVNEILARGMAVNRLHKARRDSLKKAGKDDDQYDLDVKLLEDGSCEMTLRELMEAENLSLPQAIQVMEKFRSDASGASSDVSHLKDNRPAASSKRAKGDKTSKTDNKLSQGKGKRERDEEGEEKPAKTKSNSQPSKGAKEGDVSKAEPSQGDNAKQKKAEKKKQKEVAALLKEFEDKDEEEVAPKPKKASKKERKEGDAGCEDASKSKKKKTCEVETPCEAPNEPQPASQPKRKRNEAGVESELAAEIGVDGEVAGKVPKKPKAKTEPSGEVEVKATAVPKTSKVPAATPPDLANKPVNQLLAIECGKVEADATPPAPARRVSSKKQPETLCTSKGKEVNDEGNKEPPQEAAKKEGKKNNSRLREYSQDRQPDMPETDTFETSWPTAFN